MSPDIGYLVIALVTTPRFFRQNNMDFRGGVGFVSWQATLKLDTSARLNGSLVRQDRNIRLIDYGTLSLNIFKPVLIRGLY